MLCGFDPKTHASWEAKQLFTNIWNQEINKGDLYPSFWLFLDLASLLEEWPGINPRRRHSLIRLCLSSLLPNDVVGKDRAVDGGGISSHHATGIGGVSSPHAERAPRWCGATALDQDLGKDGSQGGGPRIPRFGGCGGCKGSTSTGPRCSRL
jgi:hypothetical protein